MNLRLAFVCGLLLCAVILVICYCFQSSKEPDDEDDLGYLEALGGDFE